MAETPPQTVRHRRLSAELKRLREARGMGTVEATQRLNWDRTKLNRIERGDWKRLKEVDIRALAKLYGVTDQAKQDALVALAKQANQKGWWTRYSDVLGAGAYVSMEAEASEFRFYGGLMVPGLLQTPSYAKALIRDGGVTDDSEVKRRVEARLARQEILERSNPPAVRAIVDEAALRKLVGGSLTMREQLLRLMLLNEQETAEVRVLPDAVGGHQAMTGQFVLLGFPSKEQAPVVFIDISRDGLFLEEPEDIERYSEKFEGLCSLSLSPEESNDHMARLVDELAK